VKKKSGGWEKKTSVVTPHHLCQARDKTGGKW
jgi:hypothetical protein